MKRINWRYTLGEIIIVMIGISLAFALNRWNERRKEADLRKAYIQGLAMDIEKEINHLTENDTLIKQRIGSIREILTLLNSSINERKKAIPKIFEIANAVEFYPENVTYQTMINSGDMRLINDFAMKRKIESHYNQQHQNTKNNFERIMTINKEHLGSFFINDIDYASLSKGKVTFLENPRLGNILRSLNGAYLLALKANEACIKSNVKLLKAMKSN